MQESTNIETDSHPDGVVQVPAEAEAPPNPKALSLSDLKDNPEAMTILGTYGVTLDALEAAEQKASRRAARKGKANQRSVHIENIQKYSGEIRADHGSNLVTAEEIRTSLLRLGVANGAEGRPLKGGNALGDACGVSGMRLPRVRIEGRWRYDLGLASGTEAEKASRQAFLDEMLDPSVKALCKRAATPEIHSALPTNPSIHSGE